MRRLNGLRNLLFDGVEEATNLVEKTHRSVTDKTVKRVSLARPLAGGARAAGAIEIESAGMVYSTIRGVNTLVRTLVDTGAGAVGGNLPAVKEWATPQSSDAAGTLNWLVDSAEGALNGVVGDYLARRGNRLDLGMGFRLEGNPVAVEKEALAALYPDATGRIVVFVHGLSCTEWEWNLFARQYYGDPRVNFGSRLKADLGLTPFFVRYNTGRHVSESGRDLSELLEAFIGAYPVKVKDLILVGHSMGGLVVRSAAASASSGKKKWVKKLRSVFCLGAPNLGAPMEKAANMLSCVLRSFDTPGTKVPAAILDARSSGIKDLRFGYTADSEWQGKDPDSLLEDNRENAPLVDRVGYYSVAATITKDPEHPLGRILGDLLVRVPSAAGAAKEPARRIPFSAGSVFGGMTHFHLSNHPAVYEIVKMCIESSPSVPRLPGPGEKRP